VKPNQQEITIGQHFGSVYPVARVGKNSTTPKEWKIATNQQVSKWEGPAPTLTFIRGVRFKNLIERKKTDAGPRDNLSGRGRVTKDR